MPVEQYALVPVDDGRAILAVDGSLPRIQEASSLRDALVSFEPLIGRPIYLRLAAHDATALLRVFDAGEGDGIPLDDVDPDVAVPPPLRAAFAQAVAELRGAPVPERRPAWSRPGWHAHAEAWAGMPLEQVRVWPLSAVLRNGDVWLKAVFPLFHHEPAITQAIGEPRVLRADHERGWMLLEHVPGEEASDYDGALRSLARIHAQWRDRVDELLALGVQDRRRASTIPYTIVHGDFHPWNVLGSTIVDWSDAAVANPLYDVNHYLLNVPEELRDELLDTYADAAEADYDVHAAAAAYEAETYEDVALSYRRITAALAPDDTWWFANEEPRWLARASDVRAGRRPSRGT
jgi:Phosphotransferase enzyme family